MLSVLRVLYFIWFKLWEQKNPYWRFKIRGKFVEETDLTLQSNRICYPSFVLMRSIFKYGLNLIKILSSVNYPQFHRHSEVKNTLYKKYSKCLQYTMKCRGKRDTNIPSIITFSSLHFMIYRGKSITFVIVYLHVCNCSKVSLIKI